MTQYCSTFAIKYFWQILNMICKFAKLIVVDPYMPSCCRYAWFVMHCSVVSASSSQRGLHINISAMLCFLLSLKPDNETCYLYMLAIISSGPCWLMVSKDFCHVHLVEHYHAFFLLC